MKILKVIYNNAYKSIFSRNKEIEAELGGVKLRVKEGTIRKRPDMDDAWYAFLAAHARTVLDVGCNVGYDALIAFVYGKPDKVVLVDPNPEALSVAARNLIINGYSHRSQFVLALISDSIQKKEKFFTIGTGAAGSIYPGFAKSAKKLNSWYWVSTETVDNLVTSMNFVSDLVKIDVEGAESKVLEGATSLCTNHRVRIIVELHSGTELSMYDNAKAVLSWCNRVDYQAWYMKGGRRLDNPENIAHRGRCHVLLLPAGEEYPEQLTAIAQRAPLPVVQSES